MSKNEKLYSFDELKEMMGVDGTRLFELIASPATTKHTINNNLFFDKKTVRYLTLMGEK